MKIIFNDVSGTVGELHNVTKDTTLRDVKQYYERISKKKRSEYNFKLNQRCGHVNHNSLMTFFDYLRSVHYINIDPDNLKKDEILEIYVTFHVQNHVLNYPNLFKHEQPIPAHATAARLLCTRSREIVEGMPIKINDKYYDVEFFADHLLLERRYYCIALQAGEIYTLKCPNHKPLPGVFEEIITDKYAFVFHNTEAMQRQYILTCLIGVFNRSIEQYEDELSAAKKTVRGLK